MINPSRQDSVKTVYRELCLDGLFKAEFYIPLE